MAIFHVSNDAVLVNGYRSPFSLAVVSMHSNFASVSIDLFLCRKTNCNFILHLGIVLFSVRKKFMHGFVVLCKYHFEVLYNDAGNVLFEKNV